MAIRRTVSVAVLIPLLALGSACVPGGGTPPVATTTTSTTTIPRQCEVEFRTIRTAAAAYRAQEGVYPSTVAELETMLGEPLDLTRWSYVGGGAGYHLVGLGVCIGLEHTRP